MNKKMLVSILALGSIVASSANAAVTKEQCSRSDKTVWVENVTNSDGTRGACVPKNACDSKAFKDKFCDMTFQDIQVKSVDDAHTIINTYVKSQLKWTDGCTEFLDLDVNNATGQDYIGCISNGKYRTFEFDDTNELYPTTYVPDLRKALCIASGGQYDGGTKCDNIGNDVCLAIQGAYDSTIPTCNLGAIQQDVLERYNQASDALDAMSDYQLRLF